MSHFFKTRLLTYLGLGSLGSLLIGFVLVIYSFMSLQAGLEQPSDAAVLMANVRTTAKSFPKPISAYNKFSVAVTNDISVTVYARENEAAIGNVLLVHGAGSGAWAWEYFFELMPSNFNLYAMSWRGHFDSSPVIDARAQDYVQDQKAVLAAITMKNDLPNHLVGHSYGAATSILQTSQSPLNIDSLFLLAPVVPLDYSTVQALVVPTVGPYFIRQDLETGNKVNGVYGKMFLSKHRMLHYFKKYAQADYSKEKPGLIAGDGVSVEWQKTLADAYHSVNDSQIPTMMFIARYDSVVVPQRQQLFAIENEFKTQHIESGHYIPLDAKAEEVITMVSEMLAKRHFSMKDNRVVSL